TVDRHDGDIVRWHRAAAAMVVRVGAAMKLEVPTPLLRWPDGERVEPVDEIVRALRRRPERG
ncbi:MAG: hypothetical protein O9972_21475, partial [Burkholderiales bacterium]|nr:hypothetical protein [Burkholderiales bacterium]